MSNVLAKGASVTILGQGLKFGTYGLGLIILSRLLTPETFGAFAVMTAVIGFGELFRDFGLTAAALQSKILTNKQASNLFWANLVIGACLSFLLFGSADLVAGFFNIDSLGSALRSLSVVFLLMGAQAQYQVKLARSGRFGHLAIADILGQIFGIGVAITLATLEYGIWALVAQQVSTQLVVLVYRVATTKWIPGLPSRGAEIAPFFRYGFGLGSAQLLTYAGSNADTFFIGRFHSAYSLGLYNRAFQLLALPVRQILTPLTNVFLPTLAQLKDSNEQFNELLIRLQNSLGIILNLAFNFTIVTAPALLPLILGDQWSNAATLFQIMAVGGIFQAYSYFSYWVFLSKGLTGSLFRYNLVSKLFTVIVVGIAATQSVVLVAVAYSFALLVSWPLNLFWLRKESGIPSRFLFISGLRNILLSGIPSIAALMFSNVFDISGLNLLLLGFASAGVSCCLLSCVRSNRLLLHAAWRRIVRFTSAT